ncbi:MAG: raffinose/stachyose/melibiose transport system substrate-binding protein [Thermoanaerobacterium sp.]|nr:raffinose/stachyose/melibiose transport system substrate-binding protein [Thermoanaerobacterium sp.]
MKKTVGIKFLTLALIMTIVFSFSACGNKTSTNNSKSSSNNEKVTIRLAHTYTGADPKASYFQAELKKFEEEHPEINLVQETAAGDELRNKIKVELAANNLPDVFTYWGGSILKPLVVDKKVLNIDEYLKVSKSLKKSDFSDGAWAFYTYNGVPYGIPTEGYVSALVANKKLFAEYNLQYPKTEQDLLNVAKVFNQHGIVPLAVGSKGGNPSHFYFSELYNQLPNGTQEIEDLTSSYKFNTANALKVAQIIDEQRKAGVFPKDTVANGDWTPSAELYNSEKAAMTYLYPWTMGLIKPEIAANSVIIDMPKIDGATKDPSTFVSSSAVFGLVINNDSFHDPKKQKAIVELVDFLTSDEMFKELAKGGMVPAKNIPNMDKSVYPPMLKAALDYADKLEKVPDHYNTWPDDNSFTVFQNTLDDLWAGAISPQGFVDKVQKALDSAKSSK